MGYTIRSLYLCVTDMERAIRFYEAFLEQPVTERNEIYSVFDLSGFRLGLFAFEKMKEPHRYGNSCLPSIEVESLPVLLRKLDGQKVVFPVKAIGKNWVCEVEDSEGNTLELTAPLQAEQGEDGTVSHACGSHGRHR